METGLCLGSDVAAAFLFLWTGACLTKIDGQRCVRRTAVSVTMSVSSRRDVTCRILSDMSCRTRTGGIGLAERSRELMAHRIDAQATTEGLTWKQNWVSPRDSSAM